jgi:hypothetical protein
MLMNSNVALEHKYNINLRKYDMTEHKLIYNNCVLASDMSYLSFAVFFRLRFIHFFLSFFPSF